MKKVLSRTDLHNLIHNTGIVIEDGFTTSFVEKRGQDRVHKIFFDALTTDGVKKEGEAFRDLCTTPEEAWALWRNKFFHYLQDKMHVLESARICSLYIREWPQLVEREAITGSKRYTVYSRLVLAPIGYTNPKSQPTVKESMENQMNIGVAEIDYLHPGWRCKLKGPNPENKSGFRATGHRILVEPVEVEKKTASGILLVDKTVDAEEQRSVIVKVLEIGPDAWSDKSTDYCKVGDKILIGMYVGKFHTSPLNGKKYRFISDLDVISPITEAE